MTGVLRMPDGSDIVAHKLGCHGPAHQNSPWLLADRHRYVKLQDISSSCDGSLAAHAPVSCYDWHLREERQRIVSFFITASVPVHVCLEENEQLEMPKEAASPLYILSEVPQALLPTHHRFASLQVLRLTQQDCLAWLTGDLHWVCFILCPMSGSWSSRV